MPEHHCLLLAGESAAQNVISPVGIRKKEKLPRTWDARASKSYSKRSAFAHRNRTQLDWAVWPQTISTAEEACGKKEVETTPKPDYQALAP